MSKPQRKPGRTDEFNMSLLESYKRRRLAIAQMPELPPSPQPLQRLPKYGTDSDTPAQLEDARTQRIGHLRGRVAQAFAAAKGNPADGRWGALSDLLRLGCTAGREGRWAGVRLDPLALDCGQEDGEEEDLGLKQLDWVLAETEAEWVAWEARYEKRVNLVRRVGQWSRGVVLEPDAEGDGESAVRAGTEKKRRQKERRRSPLHRVVASADDRKPEGEVVEVEEERVGEEAEPAPAAAVAPTALTPTPEAKRRVARMSTGGKSPRRAKLDEPAANAVASTSAARRVVNITSLDTKGKTRVVDITSTADAVPDALKSGALFGFGVVKRASASSMAKGKGKERAMDADAPPPKKSAKEKERDKEKEKEDERKRRAKAKVAEEERKKQERVAWERERARKLKEAREREQEREKAKEREREMERQRRQQEEHNPDGDGDEESQQRVETKGEKEKEKANNVRQRQIQDVSEMSFIPPSFPSSAVLHSTPKPLARPPARPFGLRSNTSSSLPRVAETSIHNRSVNPTDKNPEKDNVLEPEESSYSLGISMVTSAGLPSQIIIPPTTTKLHKKKRARPVSPSPSPVARSERPEKKARNGNHDAREAPHRELVDESVDVSFLPPSFPQGGIVTSTPKPQLPSKSNTPDNDENDVVIVAAPKSPPAAEESSYGLGISLVTSAGLPSQIIVPPTTTTNGPKPVSPAPPERPDASQGGKPEEDRSHDDGARDEDPTGDVIEISFMPPSFPPGGIVTSTPKPPSKSTSAGEVQQTANSADKQRVATPPPTAVAGSSTTSFKPTRPFLLPPTPKSKALEASVSLPALPTGPPSSPTTKIRQVNANKRPASPSVHVRENALKKAKTMPIVSPPSSPTRTPTKGQKRADDLVVARTTLLNVRHILADQDRVIQQVDSEGLKAATGNDKGLVGADIELPVTPHKQKARSALPTLTDLLASARSGKGRSAASSPASAKKPMTRKKATLIVRTPSGERVDVMAVRSIRPKPSAQTRLPPLIIGMQVDGVQEIGLGRVDEERRTEQEQEESHRETAEPSTIGTGLENYQQLKAAANASMDVFLDTSTPDNALSESSQPVKGRTPTPPPAEPTDPYSDAYHFTEDIVVPTGSKLRTFPGAGGSYPFGGSQGTVDPYADNDPYDDPYASAGEHVGISPTKSLSSLAGSDSDSDGAADDSDDGLGPAHALRRPNRAFGAGVLSPGFVFDPRAASTQVPPGLTFGVSTPSAGSLFSAVASRAESAAVEAEGAKGPASQESKDSWASMYVSSVPAERASSSSVPPPSAPGGDPAKDPSAQHAVVGVQPVLSSSPPIQAEQDSSPVRVPPSSSNPLFTFSSQAFGNNLAKHVDMVSRLLDKDVDFAGWLKDPEEIDEPARGVEESP